MTSTDNAPASPSGDNRLRPAADSGSDKRRVRRVPHLYVEDLLIFEAEGYLFRVAVDVMRESEYFRDMLAAEHIGKHGEGYSDDHPIVLNGITAREFKNFLSVLCARTISGPLKLKESQLKDVLHLSTMWGFEAVREYAIKEIDNRFSSWSSTDPFDRLALADKCNVAKWRYQAYLKICTRAEPLTVDEGAQLGIRRFATVARIRETRTSRAEGDGRRPHCSHGCRRHEDLCPEARWRMIERALEAEAETLDMVIPPRPWSLGETFSKRIMAIAFPYSKMFV